MRCQLFHISNEKVTGCQDPVPVDGGWVWVTCFQAGDLMRGWFSWCVKRCWFQDSIHLQGSVSTPAPPGPNSRLRVFPVLFFFLQVTATTRTYEGMAHYQRNWSASPSPTRRPPLRHTSRLGVFKITASQSANGPTMEPEEPMRSFGKACGHCHLPTWLWMKSKS